MMYILINENSVLNQLLIFFIFNVSKPVINTFVDLDEMKLMPQRMCHEEQVS